MAAIPSERVKNACQLERNQVASVRRQRGEVR